MQANDVLNIDEWKKNLKEMVITRKWEKYHNPQNLIKNLSVEANELLEIFTWVNQEDTNEKIQDEKTYLHIQQEMGDCLMTLIMLADELSVNLSEALTKKVAETKKRYPIPEN